MALTNAAAEAEPEAKTTTERGWLKAKAAAEAKAEAAAEAKAKAAEAKAKAKAAAEAKAKAAAEAKAAAKANMFDILLDCQGNCQGRSAVSPSRLAQTGQPKQSQYRSHRKSCRSGNISFVPFHMRAVAARRP